MNEKMTANTGEEAIDLIALAMSLLRHWKAIVFATVTLAIGAFGYSRYLITPMYSSMARLYVLSKSTSITSLADIQMGANLTNDYLLVASSRPVLDQVIKELYLDEDYKSLYAKVKVSNPSNTRILDITVQDSDPERAKAIVDTIAEVSARFIAEKMDQDPPSIIQYGYSDNEKVSPSVPKNTVIGGLAGAFISSAIAVLFFLINNTIESTEDVENKLGLKVIAQIPLEREENDEYGQKKAFKSKKRRRAEH